MGAKYAVPYAERAIAALIAADIVSGNNATVSASSSSFRALVKMEPSVEQATFRKVPDGETLRKIARRLRSPFADLRAMHVSKAMSSRGHAHALEYRAADLVFGFPGASLAVFSRSNELKVLHAVDAHPRAHNEALLKHYDPAVVRAELYPAWLVRLIEAEAAAADVVLVPSQLVAMGFVDAGVDPRKIVVEPYGSAHKVFAPSLGTGVVQNVISVIYVGQVSARKGLPFLVEAAKQLPGHKFTVVGREFDKRILRDMPDNMQHLEHVSHDELSALLGSADVLALPTVEDACALVTFEAATAGLPVISSRNNGAMEILGGPPHRVIPAGSVQSLVAELKNMQPLSATQRKKNAFEAVKKVRDWSEYGSDTVNRLRALREN